MRVRGSIDVGLGAQKDCDHIVLLSPYNQHHHRPHGRIRVDIQWNCDGIIFLSETGRNNWTHRPPSGSTILCRLIMQQIMTLENTRERKFLIRFFLPLGRSFFVGGLRCWQDRPCGLLWNPSQRPLVGAKTRIWCCAPVKTRMLLWPR